MDKDGNEYIDISPVLKYVSINILLKIACLLHRFYSEIRAQGQKRYYINECSELEKYLMLRVGNYMIPNWGENRFIKNKKNVAWITKLIDNQFFNIKNK